LVSVGDSESDAYWKAILLRAADRVVRFAVRDKLSHGAAIKEDERDKRLSRRLSRDWVLTVGFGIALFAAILYLTLSVHLHSSAVEVTKELSDKTMLNECCPMIGARVAIS
jgi:uncharacterized membrane protein